MPKSLRRSVAESILKSVVKSATSISTAAWHGSLEVCRPELEASQLKPEALIAAQTG